MTMTKYEMKMIKGENSWYKKLAKKPHESV